jgi:predicted  nucleic acid-binding Zn-ribbon protein
MARQAVSMIDNRDSQEMYGYLEARIETLKRRIAELERENQMLHALIATKNDSSTNVQVA